MKRTINNNLLQISKWRNHCFLLYQNHFILSRSSTTAYRSYQYAPSHYGAIKARSSSLRPSLWPQAWFHNGGRDQHKFQIDTTHITHQNTLVTVDKIIILRLQKTGHIPTRAFQPKETYLAPSGFGKGYPKSSFSTTRLLVYIYIYPLACMRVIGWGCVWLGRGEGDTRN